jgi:hypothetical protein
LVGRIARARDACTSQTLPLHCRSVGRIARARDACSEDLFPALLVDINQKPLGSLWVNHPDITLRFYKELHASRVRA